MFGSYHVDVIASVIGSSFGRFLLTSPELGMSAKYFFTSSFVSSISISPATTNVALFGLWYLSLNFLKSSKFAASRSLSNLWLAYHTGDF